MHYVALSKYQYLELVHSRLEDPKDIRFSKVAMGMWDFMKAWDKWPVRTLWEDNDIVSSCFMKLSNQAGSKVLFISNIFTPVAGRGKGLAKEMLDRNIKEAVDIGATSIRLDCNRKALPFYDKLGVTYWGATVSESMFCDLPINEKGVLSFLETKDMPSEDILNSYNTKLREAKMKWINRKVHKHRQYDFGHPSRYDEFIDLMKKKDVDLEQFLQYNSIVMLKVV